MAQSVLKRLIPWWAKLSAKVLLSRTPFGYRLWQSLSLFVHGKMDDPEYAFRVVRSHLERVGWNDLSGRRILELGPGDSLASAVIGRALGADEVILLDAGNFATRELQPYLALATHLRERGLVPPDLTRCTSVEEILTRCNARYLTNGLHDLRKLADGSVDLVFSQAVLEHVRRDELAETLAETYRIAAPGGVTSHQVDLKDHLGGALNHLRFTQRTWESEWMAASGFYTNRVRYTEMKDLFERAGWTVELAVPQRWSDLPTARESLAEQFRSLPADELLVSQFDIRARRA
jgi:SAM-dependent methyltransferase